MNGSWRDKGIARDVFQKQQISIVDPMLRAAYRATHYLAAAPSGETVRPSRPRLARSKRARIPASLHNAQHVGRGG